MCVDSPSTHASILFNSENFGRFKTVSVDGFFLFSHLSSCTMKWSYHSPELKDTEGDFSVLHCASCTALKNHVIR